MDRRVLKYNVAAALFSAAFLFGISSADAYTYSGGTVTVDQVAEDENDLVVTDSAKVISNNKINPFKNISYYEESDITTNSYTLYCYRNTGWTSHVNIYLSNIPYQMSEEMFADFKKVLFYENAINNNTNEMSEYFRTQLKTFNSKYGLNLTYSADVANQEWSLLDTWFFSFSRNDDGTLTYTPSMNVDTFKDSGNKITYKEKRKIETNEAAAITISKNSTLISKGDISTTKNIKVLDTSYLEAANSIIGGDILSTNSIKTGGLAKGKVLNVSAINAASASFTGNQSISGVFTATGQAKLNGGAALGNKKINRLSAGTLSATSTDAVNGSQLNTIKQKLATAGKTYSAGSDVAITAANAISVTKSGVVDKGNTGIVTGGAVYKITSALNQSLDSLKTSVSSHQSTLTTLSQGLSDLKSSVTNINSSVASATKNLSAQLTNRLQSDMGNLSDDGKNVIRNMVSSTLKSMNSMSIGAGAKSVSAIAIYGAGNDVEDDRLADIRTGLDSKMNRGDFDQVSTTVTSNSKAIDKNISAIQKNVGDIADLKESKADVDGSNISVDGYAKCLGVGTVVEGNTSLVTGDTVYAALDKKADYGYVAGGLGMVSSELDAMSQRMTSDLNRVGAGASALAGLHPTGYNASDKLSFAYGGGHYKNVNTSALGAFYHPNEKTMVSLAGTIGNADAMLSAGISIKVGMGNHVSKVMVTPKMFGAQEVANQDMKDHLDTQAERIRQIELALQNR